MTLLHLGHKVTIPKLFHVFYIQLKISSSNGKHTEKCMKELGTSAFQLDPYGTKMYY